MRVSVTRMQVKIVMQSSKLIVGKCATVQVFGKESNKKNSNQEELRKRLNSGNACNHSVQNLLSSRLLSRKAKIRIYENILSRIPGMCAVV
jgi:hypothetical protein